MSHNSFSIPSVANKNLRIKTTPVLQKHKQPSYTQRCSCCLVCKYLEQHHLLNKAFSAFVSPSSLFHIPRAEINIPVLKGTKSHESTRGNWTSWQGISHYLHSYISLNAKPTRAPLIELILISKAWACSPSRSSRVCILVSALCSSQFSQVEK